MAELTVNRRQANPVEREALTMFRQGHIDTSQELRDQAGWEHHHADRNEALDAMAAAVLADIDIYGPEGVAALAVTHTDCEAIADRIRADLVSQGVIAGLVLEGPGWASVRSYQTGDRIVLHAHAELQDGRHLTNGTVATITEVTPTGLTVRDSAGAAAVLPARFVAERGADGRPRVSHAWGRTIDGIQGGTWAQVHLLATPALDRSRGYVGQSRSIAPTHTWNTTSPRADDGDHGGRVGGEGYSTPAEVIAAALARAQPKTFAAVDDPYRIDADLRAERRAHRDHLAHRPPDVSDHIDAADKVIAGRQQTLADLEDQVRYWQDQQDANAGLRGITPGRREKHHTAARYIENLGPSLQQAHHHLTAAITKRDALVAQQADREVFDRDNHWRVERLDQLQNQLDRHWTDAVIQAARDGHPTAYGTQLLYVARRDLAKEINDGQAVADSGPPVDFDAIRDLQMLHRAIPEAAQHQNVVRVAAQARPAPGRSAHASHQHVAKTGASRGPTVGT